MQEMKIQSLHQNRASVSCVCATDIGNLTYSYRTPHMAADLPDIHGDHGIYHNGDNGILWRQIIFM
jgi:hypothetical protein